MNKLVQKGEKSMTVYTKEDSKHQASLSFLACLARSEKRVMVKSGEWENGFAKFGSSGHFPMHSDALALFLLHT